MAFVHLHALYTRTCNICGDHWVVTRRQAKGAPARARRPKTSGAGRSSIAGGPGRSYDVGTSRSMFEAAVEQWQAWRRCPTCGIDDFSQAAVKRNGGG